MIPQTLTYTSQLLNHLPVVGPVAANAVGRMNTVYQNIKDRFWVSGHEPVTVAVTGDTYVRPSAPMLSVDAAPFPSTRRPEDHFASSSSLRAKEQSSKSVSELSKDIEEVMDAFENLDPEDKKKRFNNWMAWQGWFDYGISLFVGGEGRRQQRLDADEAQGNHFLNPGATEEGQVHPVAMIIHKAQSLLGSAAAAVFGPGDYNAFLQNEDQQAAYNRRGNFLYSFESFMRYVSGMFFSQIFKGSHKQIAEMVAELKAADVSPDKKSRYLKRFLNFAQAEYRFQSGESGMMRYYMNYILFRSLTWARPRQHGVARRTIDWTSRQMRRPYDSVISRWEKFKVRRQAKKDRVKTGIQERLQNPAPYLSKKEIASLERLKTEGTSGIKERAQLSALKGLAVFGVPIEERPDFKQHYNGNRSSHKGKAKLAALLMHLTHQSLGPAAASLVLSYMHYHDVNVSIAATRTYPLQIMEIIASEDDSAKGGVLRLLFKGSGSEVGKGMMAFYSLCMGAYIVYALATGDANVTSWDVVFDEAVQARKSMPTYAQIPITGMFVVGAATMLGAIDAPKLVKTHFNLAKNLIQRNVHSSTGEKLGDVAAVVSAYIGVAASSMSIAAFYYYSHMIDMALGFYLSSIAATLDFSQTKFDNFVLDRAAKRLQK